MAAIRLLLLVLPLAAALGLVGPCPSAHAAIVTTGNVEPANPAAWTISNDAYIGNAADGSLTVDSGDDVLSRFAFLGYESGATGTVTIDGDGSTWKNDARLFVGFSGNGSMSFLGGAAGISRNEGYIGYNAGSVGTMTVNGIGSQWTTYDYLYTGHNGQGTLNIADGGTVSSGKTTLGAFSGSTGTVNVDGHGSSLTVKDEFYIGGGGDGALNITAGGTVYSSLGGDYNRAYVGGAGDSAVSVDGVGSTWSNMGEVRVGRGSGSGTVNVTAGGTVTSRITAIGYDANSTGLVVVEGAGSTWSCSDSLLVGGDYAYQDNQAVGTMKILDGAAVTVAKTTYVSNSPNAVGVLEFDGGTLTTGSLAANAAAIRGFGTINARGLVSDVELVFDSAASLTRTLVFNSGPDQNVTVNLDLATAPTTNGALGAGWKENGSIAIRNGVTVYSTLVYLGQQSGSSGTAVVEGSGSKWDNKGSLYVGYHGAGTLAISNSGSVDSYSTTIGYMAGSTGSVTVDGSGSTLSVNGFLTVHGTLDVIDGAKVTASTLTASGTAAVISLDGLGSQLITSATTSIDNGATVRITGGATATTKGGVNLGNSWTTGTAIIDGPGSKWSTTGSFKVGRTGHGVLTVTGGATLSSGGGSISGLNNTISIATIDGVGSSWTSSLLTVGESGHGMLNITGGATVNSLSSSTSSAYIGQYHRGDVTVDGAGSVWNVRSYTFGIGYEGIGTLNITGGGTVSMTFVDSKNEYICLGYNEVGTGTATVSGPGSTWTIGGDLLVGYSGSGTLTVTDGGAVTARALFAPVNQLSGNGSITVKGAVLDGHLEFAGSEATQATVAFGTGGVLSVHADGTGALGAGYKGNGSLSITNGAIVASSMGSLGDRPGSNGTALVSGPGSTWNSTGPLRAGQHGTATLRVELGGQLSNTIGYMGDFSGASATATVSGAGSTWTNSGDLFVGNRGNATLNVEAGAVVSNAIGYLAHGSGGTAAATVSGAGSTWTNSGNLYIGHSGKGELTIDAGGQVSSAAGYLGLGGGATGTATIRGAGSKWSNTGLLYVGNAGKATLNIASGAEVSSGAGYLASGLSSTGTVIVSGAGSKWTSSGTLNVGVLGTATLAIEAGGEVSNLSGYLGGSTGSSGKATISGNSSRWINGGDLYVGNSGSGTLTVEAGGEVSSASGYLGNSVGSSGTATVRGNGSRWANSGDLYVGKSGSGTLTVLDGGAVTADTLYASSSHLFGNGTITTSSGAVVDAHLAFDGNQGPRGTASFGTGGTLTVNVTSSGVLGVGYKESGSVSMTDAVMLSSAAGYLGYHSGATGVATISGAGSTWTNSGEFHVGRSGAGVLSIVAGGRLASTTGYLGYNAGSTGTATVSGPGSRWDNTGSLHLGFSGTGRLTVADSGVVTTGMLYGSLGDLSGDGTVISSHGALLDGHLVFDGNLGPGARGAFGDGGTLIVDVDGDSVLGVGYRQDGSLGMTAGIAVSSSLGYLGYNAGSAGTATISGPGTTWTNSGNLYVGHSGSGAMTIDAGGQVSNTTGYLGFNASSTGTATVSGVGSKWINAGALYVGDSGTGTLTVLDGGEVIAETLYASLGNLSGNGTITVSNGALLDGDFVFDGSQWPGATVAFGTGGTLSLNTGDGILGAGYKQNGSVSVIAGAEVASATAHLGSNAGSNGTALISGAGSKWTTGSFFVGHSGNGSLTIDAGGELDNSDGDSYLGHNPGSSGAATVRGTGSKWIASDFVVGNYGSGTLNIEAGGIVRSINSSLGRELNSTGIATVSGAGSIWSATTLYVGGLGSGTLNIDGGLVAAQTLRITYDNWGSGTLNLDNGGYLRFETINRGNGLPRFNWHDGVIANYEGAANLTVIGGVVLWLASTGTHTFHIDADRMGIINGTLADATTGGTLNKTGLGTLLLTAVNSYSGDTTVEEGLFKVTGTVLRTSGISIGESATLELARAGRSATADTVPIANDGTLLISTAGQEVGTIIGMGVTHIDASGSLTADWIVQDSLIIGAGGQLTLRSSGDSTAPEHTATVPEPSTIAMLLIALLAAIGVGLRSRR
jgi:T5SS/PEP-CTERM-associated repeat protein